MLFPISIFLLTGCASNIFVNYKKKDTISFEGVVINALGSTNEEKHKCEFKNNGNVYFDEELSSFRWEIFGASGLLRLTDENEEIFVSYDVNTHSHYFFMSEIDKEIEKTYKYVAYNPDFYNEYDTSTYGRFKPSYEVLSAYVFTGPGITSGEKTTAELYFLYDNSRTVYIAPIAMKESETKYLIIGHCWEEGFKGTLSFETYDNQYKSYLNNDGVMEFNVDGDIYTLVD